MRELFGPNPQVHGIKALEVLTSATAISEAHETLMSALSEDERITLHYLRNFECHPWVAQYSYGAKRKRPADLPPETPLAPEEHDWEMLSHTKIPMLDREIDRAELRIRAEGVIRQHGGRTRAVYEHLARKLLAPLQTLRETYRRHYRA